MGVQCSVEDPIKTGIHKRHSMHEVHDADESAIGISNSKLEHEVNRCHPVWRPAEKVESGNPCGKSRYFLERDATFGYVSRMFSQTKNHGAIEVGNTNSRYNEA